jgi:uncharacterized protein DUF4157
MNTRAFQTGSRSPARQLGHGRVQMKAKPGPAGAANHMRADGLERQADDIARRFVAGEKGLARRITPTGAAAFSLPASGGLPLHKDLREELEESFGANLAAVRIHEDSNAAHASEEHCANAFTSGRDVFFAKGKFRPQSREGKLLIAHELAHVLQQTGRPSSDGKLKATPQRGNQLVQLDADIPAFDTLRELHAPKKKEQKAKYDEVAKELAKRVATTAAKEALDKFFQESLSEIKDWPSEAESLLFDTLKRYEKFDLAAQLIERDDFKGGIRIRTAAWTDAFVPVLEARNKGQSVFVVAAEKHPVLAWYLEEWVRLIGVFILGPVSAPVPKLRRFGLKEGDTSTDTISEHTTELSNNLDENKQLSSSEWVYNGLLKIERLDQLRISKCIDINNEAIKEQNKTNEATVYLKRRFAEGVQKWGSKFVESTADIFKSSSGAIDTDAKAAWEPLLKKLGARIRKIGATAIDLWDRKSALDEAANQFHESPKDGEAKALAEAAKKKLKPVKSAGEKSGLPDEIIHVLRELNRPGKGNESPAPTDEFVARADALVKRLTEFSEAKLEKPQPQLFYEQKTDDVIAYIWLTIWVHEWIRFLLWVAGGPPGNPNVALIDQRIHERLSFARRALWLAKALEWNEVIKEAEIITSAKKEQDSVLAILPYEDGRFWRHRPEVPIEDLSKLQSIKSWEPLTGTHLALLYRKSYYEAVAAKIKELTPTSDEEEKRWVEAGGIIPFIAAKADKEVKKLPFPEYWSVKNYDWAIKPGSKKSFSQLIIEHHSFNEIQQHGTQASLSWILPLEPGQVFAWFIPYISTVMPTLRGIDLLNAQVAAGLPGKDDQKKLEEAKKLDDDTWRKKLSERITRQLKDEKMTKEELRTLQASLTTALEGEKEQAWEQLLLAIKKGSRLDRQVIAKWSIQFLKKYDDDKNAFDAPQKALEPVIRFFVAVSMLEEQDVEAEMTALMLEIAPELDAAFEYETRFDVVHPWLGWMEAAVQKLPTFLAMDPKARHVFLPDYENTKDWLDPRVASLQSVTAHFKAVRESVQRKSGYKALAKDQGFKVFMAYSSGIPVGTKLYPREGQSILGEAKSVHYVVTKILRDFVYHPAYGYGNAGQEQEEKGKKKKKQAKAKSTGYAEAKFLELDDKTPLVLAKDEKLLEVRILNRKDELIAEKQVGPADVDILADIHNGLAWAAFGSAMGNIQAGIEWYVNTMLDLAEFIPGVGQGIAVARIVATIVEFWADGDWEKAKEILAGGIRQIMDGLLTRIKDAADPENLIQLLLFGDPRLDGLLAHSTVGKDDATAPAKSSSGTDKFAKAKKVIAGFRRLGKALAKALRKLHDRVQVPMEDFHTFSATRPLLSFALQFIADHIFTIAKIAATLYEIGTKEDRPKGVAEDLKATLKEQQQSFGARFHEILKQVEQFQLPEKILDFPPVIASVLTVLESFLIKRLGLKAKVGLFIAQKTGALDFFNERVAEEIVAAGVDPNILWQEKVLPEIAGKFNETRDDVVGKINGLLKPFPGVFDPIGKANKVTVTPEGEPFAETHEDYVEDVPAAGVPTTSPYPSPDRPLRLRPRSVPSHGPGQPLTPELLARAESVFRRSLKHVRLHTGSESAAMTDTFGADALTTGSHIFMRPSLSVYNGPGARILQHELVHVLQQTGRRRGPNNPDTAPIPGRPGLGLDYDPEKEQIADQIAETAGRFARESDVGQEEEGVLQPSGINLFTVQKLLHTITDLPDIKSRQELLDKKKKAKLKPREANTVGNTVDVLTNLQSHTTMLKYPDVFTAAIKLIHSRLNSNVYADPIRVAATQIASEALMDLPVPKPAKGTQAKSTPAVEQVIKPTHFARALEGYILAKTGVVLSLTFNHTKTTAPDGTEVEIIDETKPLQEIKILNIYLPYIDGRSPLWIESVKNTWPGADEDKLTKIRIQTRALFEKKGVVVGVWALFGKDFQFSYLFRKEVDELVRNALTGGTLDPKDLPHWKVYAETNKDIKPNVGVRLANYGHDDSQKSPGRESHHLTQFLIADFFSSHADNSYRPFKKSWNHPGVTWNGNEVDLISEDPGATAKENAIFVGKTKGPKSTRGKEMPTISLASSTHKSGRLHITPEADDVGGSAVASQAGAVNNEFERHIPTEIIASEQSLKDYRKKVGDKTVASETYTAVQKTYKEVERRMSDALKARMPTLELEFYKEVAKTTQYKLADETKPDEITENEKDFKKLLEAVPAVAKEHNRTGMLDLGWNYEKV